MTDATTPGTVPGSLDLALYIAVVHLLDAHVRAAGDDLDRVRTDLERDLQTRLAQFQIEPTARGDALRQQTQQALQTLVSLLGR